MISRFNLEGVVVRHRANLFWEVCHSMVDGCVSPRLLLPAMADELRTAVDEGRDVDARGTMACVETLLANGDEEVVGAVLDGFVPNLGEDGSDLHAHLSAFAGPAILAVLAPAAVPLAAAGPR